MKYVIYSILDIIMSIIIKNWKCNVISYIWLLIKENTRRHISVPRGLRLITKQEATSTHSDDSSHIVIGLCMLQWTSFVTSSLALPAIELVIHCSQILILCTTWMQLYSLYYSNVKKKLLMSNRGQTTPLIGFNGGCRPDEHPQSKIYQWIDGG